MLILFLVMPSILLAQAALLPENGAISQQLDDLQMLLTALIDVTLDPQLSSTISYLLTLHKCTLLFMTLFCFRYIRLVVNSLGFYIYSATPILSDPALTSNDVTVIVPTVDPFNPDFAECISSIAATEPAFIIIVTAGGYQNFRKASAYSNLLPLSNILVLSSPVTSVRLSQSAAEYLMMNTDLSCYRNAAKSH